MNTVDTAQEICLILLTPQPPVNQGAFVGVFGKVWWAVLDSNQ